MINMSQILVLTCCHPLGSLKLTRIVVLVITLHRATTWRRKCVETLEQGSTFWAHLVNPLFGSDFIVFDKVLIEMCLQRLISDESHAAIGAFELDSFVQLRDRNYVVTIKNK